MCRVTMRKPASVEGQCLSRGSTECPSTRCPSTGCPTGFPSNRCPSNGCPSNGCPSRQSLRAAPRTSPLPLSMSRNIFWSTPSEMLLYKASLFILHSTFLASVLSPRLGAHSDDILPLLVLYLSPLLGLSQLRPNAIFLDWALVISFCIHFPANV